MAQEREKRESSGEGGDIENVKLLLDGSPVGQLDSTGAPGTHLEKSNGKKKKKNLPSSPIHHIVLLAAQKRKPKNSNRKPIAESPAPKKVQWFPI
jgi:hypothetical protein